MVNPESMLDLEPNQMATARLGQELEIGSTRSILGPDDVAVVQLKNPVNNPPYNNWSVNQPSVPHD